MLNHYKQLLLIDEHIHSIDKDEMEMTDFEEILD